MRAAWAEADITPPPGLPMGGRGPRFAPGTEILDPLIAQALVLEDDAGRQTLWVSVDQIGVDRETGSRLRHDLAEATGIPYAAVIVNFSHTHSGPMAGIEAYATDIPAPPELTAYDRTRDGRLVTLAHQAMQRLRPATLTLHRGTSQVGINRRNRNEDGSTGMQPNVEALYLPDLPIFDIYTEDGRALLFSYACHPVIVYGSAWNAISADYPGVCRRHLRQTLGDDLHCQFVQGLTGNIRPRVLADLEAGRFRKSTPADVQTAGTTLAEDILRALDTPGERLSLSLAAASGWFPARRDPERVPPLEVWQTLADSDNELERNLGRYWAGRYASGPPLTQAESWRIGLLQLTPEYLVAWFAGEPVAEWLGHLQEWLGGRQILALGYCQDVCGYLPTDELLPEGGYEVVESNRFMVSGPGIFAPGLNEAARQAFLGLAWQMEASG
jgi:neutral ceramidase